MSDPKMETETEAAQTEPKVVEVGKAFLVVTDDGQIVGTSWRWDDQIVEPQQAVVALNAIKQRMFDVGWTAQIVLSAAPKNAEDDAATGE